MSDHKKTKAELIQELTVLRQEVARLKAVEADCAEFKAQAPRSEVGMVHIDGTEQQQGDGLLTRAGDLLQPLLDNLPDWIFIKDAESRIIRSNKTHAQVLGLDDPQEAVGKTDFDFFPPEDAARFYEEEQNFLKAGQPIIGRVGPTPAPDGEILWRSETKVPLRDEAGQIIGLIGVSRDVTELKRTEIALRENEERYRRLFEDSPISLWEEDLSVIKAFTDRLHREGITDFRIFFEQHPEVVLEYANLAEVVEVNPTTLKMYRAADKAEFFNGLGQIFGSESLETFKEEMIAVAEGKTRFAGESIHYTLTGEKIYVTLSWSVAPGYEHDYSKVAVTLIDITERKQAQEALARRAAELEAVAQVSTAAATVLQPGRLLQEVADLSKERFDLYHAHIYLLNPAGDTLYLTAGAGEVGRQMVTEGWTIPLEREHSLVARAARLRQGVIVNDVRTEPDYMPNPLLPDTRSEMAIPMIVGERVLGVLDVQADVIDRFTDEDVRIQTMLAAQVAVALQNARSYEQTQTRARHEQILRQITARVRGSTNPDAIVRAAVRELGTALDRPTFVRLGKTDQLRQPKTEREAPLVPTDSPGGNGQETGRPEGDK